MVDVLAGLRGQTTRLWHHVEHGLAATGVWTERVRGHGEDADPLLLMHRPDRGGLVAVFDGVGGAGRAPAGSGENGLARTQAWVAARRTRALLEDWFVRNGPDIDPDELAARFGTRLADGAQPRGRVRGSIHREFPSTLAGISFTVDYPQVRWDVLWAGDSRCYVAEPSVGLQQLSLDDVDVTDALELLVQDPPMTNMVCAGRDFRINTARGHATLPCVLLCATDGFFGYVSTPALFELLLWETLLSAQDSRHWAALLADRVSSFTKDDASLVLVALGFSDLDVLKASFRDRLALLRREHGDRMDTVAPDDRPALIRARERSWRSYRGTYERRLPRTAEEAR